MKKLSYEDFVKRAKRIHGEDYEYIKDSYTTTKKKMWIIHKKCKHKFQQTPHNHLIGQGCPKCCYKNRKTNYSFITKAEKLFDNKYSFPNIEEEYINSHSKITIKCNLCGKIFTKTACDFITSKYGGCQCHVENKKHITYKELKQKFPNIEIIPYDGTKNINSDKINIMCVKHGIYKKYIKDIMEDKCNCPTCTHIKYGKLRNYHIDFFENKLKIMFPTIEICDKTEYENTYKPINFKCKECNNTFRRTPSMFLYNKLSTPCPFCTKNKIKKERTKSQCNFEEQVFKIHGSKYEVIGDYIKSTEKIAIKCNDCGTIFNVEANSFLQGHGCPGCNITSLEYEIEEFFKKMNVKYEKQKTFKWLKHKRNLRLDFYLPEFNATIECQGIHHFKNIQFRKNLSILEETQKRDKLKKELCEKHDIKMFYYANYEYDFPYFVYTDKEKMLNDIKLTINNSKNFHK